MIRSIFVCAATLFAAIIGMNPSAYAECNLNGKVVHISYTICFANSGSRSCSSQSEKLRFVGTRIYRGDKTGDIYKIGATVSKYTGANNTAARPVEHSVSTAVPALNLTITSTRGQQTLTAGKSGDVITLTDHFEQTTSLSPSTEATEDVLKITFRECLSCSIERHLTSYSDGRLINADMSQTLERQSCSVR